MKSKTCTDSALHKNPTLPCGEYQERMLKYKAFAVMFSYPDNSFCEFYPQVLPEKENLQLEYDKLFRRGEIWLYTTEYQIENEFQRANQLSDISGFYRAFGLEIDSQRPDFLATELEFMHYLIFKENYALAQEIEDAQNKSSICIEAQKKFFNTYLYPGAKIICDKIIRLNNFYGNIAEELISFLESEKKIFIC